MFPTCKHWFHFSFLASQLCASPLLSFRHKKHLVEVRKTSWFFISGCQKHSWKYPQVSFKSTEVWCCKRCMAISRFWSTIKQLAMSPLAQTCGRLFGSLVACNVATSFPFNSWSESPQRAHYLNLIRHIWYKSHINVRRIFGLQKHSWHN